VLKGSGLAIPSLRAWRERIFAIDIKGELSVATADKPGSRKVFNPILDLYAGGQRVLQQQMAQILFAVYVAYQLTGQLHAAVAVVEQQRGHVVRFTQPLPNGHPEGDKELRAGDAVKRDIRNEDDFIGGVEHVLIYHPQVGVCVNQNVVVFLQPVAVVEDKIAENKLSTGIIDDV